MEQLYRNKQLQLVEKETTESVTESEKPDKAQPTEDVHDECNRSELNENNGTSKRRKKHINPILSLSVCSTVIGTSTYLKQVCAYSGLQHNIFFFDRGCTLLFSQKHFYERLVDVIHRDTKHTSECISSNRIVVYLFKNTRNKYFGY